MTLTIEIEETGFTTIVEVNEETYKSTWKEFGGGFKETASNFNRLKADHPKVYQFVDELSPTELYAAFKEERGLL